MIRSLSGTATPTVVVHPRAAVADRLPALAAFVRASAPAVPLSQHPGWLAVLGSGLGHEAYALEAAADGRTCGFLPLVHVRTLLFGRFLVSLPYLNTNGVVAESADVQARLISRAVELADELDVRYLELRQERFIDHPELNAKLTSKVHMRLPLPPTAEALWKGFDPKVRNQVRKGEKGGFAAVWGGLDLLDSFYAVICENMRDLGSPVYGKGLFREVLMAFPGDAEVCVMSAGAKPVAAGLLLHGNGVTEVPTAGAVRAYHPACVNMLLYWRLLERAVGRRQQVFDFGRSTTDAGTYKFKKQWGAVPHPAVWQYAARHGGVSDMRPDHPKYQRAIAVWRRLPVGLTRVLGPAIVRGIP